MGPSVGASWIMVRRVWGHWLGHVSNTKRAFCLALFFISFLTFSYIILENRKGTTTGGDITGN